MCTRLSVHFCAWVVCLCASMYMHVHVTSGQLSDLYFLLQTFPSSRFDVVSSFIKRIQVRHKVPVPKPQTFPWNELLLIDVLFFFKFFIAIEITKPNIIFVFYDSPVSSYSSHAPFVLRSNISKENMKIWWMKAALSLLALIRFHFSVKNHYSSAECISLSDKNKLIHQTVFK